MKLFKGNIRKIIGAAVAAGMIMTALTPQMVAADSQKVVTIGADLSESQRDSILRYFGVKGKNIKTIYVTNQDERDMLSGYISLDKIGTHALSCAYVQPKNSGGIHVKTANLTWVTSNMIASALSTSGVKNCDVIAACPIEVSGTGALTGVLMAYESSLGSALDSTKKKAATQEISTTTQIANDVGQAIATKIVNDIKIEIIQQQITPDRREEINSIVNNVVNNVVNDYSNVNNVVENNEIINDNGVTIEGDFNMAYVSDEGISALQDYAETIAAQEYSYEDVQDTVEMVENNVTQQIIGGTAPETEAAAEYEEDGYDDAEYGLGYGEEEIAPEPATLADDSILMNTDDSALGEDVVIDATDEEAVQEAPQDTPQDFEEDYGFEITTEDQGSLEGDEYTEDDEYTETDEYTEGGEVVYDGGETADAAEQEQPADDVYNEGDEYTDGGEYAEGDEYTGDGEVVYDGGETTDVVEQGQPEEEVYNDGGEYAEGDEYAEGGEYAEGDEYTEDGEVIYEGGEDVEYTEGEGSEEPADEEAYGAVPEVTFAPDGGSGTADSFALRFYVNGGFAPSAGRLSIINGDGSEVASVDLSDSGSWALRSAESAGAAVPGWPEANEISIFTRSFGLSGGEYTISGDVTFTQESDGSETAPVHVESRFRYGSSALSVADDYGCRFETGNPVFAYTGLPEGAAYADITSSNPDVASIDDGYTEGSDMPVEIYLAAEGDSVITAEYFDEEGNSIQTSSLKITAF